MGDPGEVHVAVASDEASMRSDRSTPRNGSDTYALASSVPISRRARACRVGHAQRYTAIMAPYVTIEAQHHPQGYPRWPIEEKAAPNGWDCSGTMRITRGGGDPVAYEESN